MNPTETTPAAAERYVLSAMMLNVKAVWEAVDVMPALRMVVPKHETIAHTIRALAERAEPTDVIAVVNELERLGELNRCGGPEYLHNLTSEASTWVNVGYYAEIVLRATTRDRLAAAAEKVKAIAADPAFDLSLSGESARAAVEDALEVDQTAGDEDLDAGFMEMIGEIGTTVPGFPTPWQPLTQKIVGLTPGSVYTIGARPTIGKSALALQFASTLEQHGYVGYFSLEMSTHENRQRQLAQETGIALSMIRGSKHLPDWADTRARAWAAGRKSRLLFDDRGTITVADMRQTIRTWQRKFELSGVVIDYLQLITPPDTRVPNRVQQVTEISRQIKLIAKDFKLPVIVLSQLNRALETRADKTPMLADLRESGAIEQDADVVLMLHRDTFEDEYSDDLIHLLIMKNRHGPTTSVALRWEGEFVRAV